MVRSAVAALALAVSLLGLSACAQEVLLLDFYSPSCGPCRQMMPTIDNFMKAGYPVRKVDATSDQQLASQFSVTRYPTFVMLANGREVDRIVGACPGEQIQALYQKAQQVARAASPPAPPAQPPVNNDFRGQNPETPRPTSRQSAVSPHAALLNATVRLRVDEGQSRSYGTGTIIDTRDGEALVITCGHLFRDSQGKAPLTVEMFEAMPDGVRNVGQVQGQVVCFDLDRDVALVSIRPNRNVTAARVASVRTKVQRGDRVTSIGCSNGKDPSVLETRVTNLDRYQGAPNLEAAGAPVEGRSGGGLFNAEGQLIGICYAADHEGNEGLYAAIESIHDQLAKLGLNLDEGTKVATLPPVQNSPREATPDNQPPLIRSQSQPEMTPVNPVPNRDADLIDKLAGNKTPAAALGPPPAGLRPVEQAAWEEMAKHAVTSKVVILVCPNEPGGQSEVITLENASPEFVRALAKNPRATTGGQTQTR